MTTNSYAWFEYANIVFACVNFTRRGVGGFQKQGYGFNILHGDRNICQTKATHRSIRNQQIFKLMEKKGKYQITIQYIVMI